MRRLLQKLRREKVLDETGRFSLRVNLLAIDEDFHSILRDITRVATPDGRKSLRELESAPPPAAE